MVSSEVLKKYDVPSDTQVRLAISKLKAEIEVYWHKTEDLEEEEHDIFNNFCDVLDRAQGLFTKQFRNILRGPQGNKDEPYVTKQEVDDWSYRDSYEQ